MKMSPWEGGGEVAVLPYGDINDEWKRAGSDDDHGWHQTERIDAGGGGAGAGVELSADPTGLAALPGRRRRRAGASLAGSAQPAAQAAGVARPRAGPLPPALCGLW